MDNKKNIPVHVKNRVAWSEWMGFIVCGNGDYTITFTFDEEWGEDTAKTAFFKYRTDEGMRHKKQPFIGNTVEVPILSNIREVEVGVSFGDIATTTGAPLRCVPSVRCEAGEESEYEKERFDELMQLFNDWLHEHKNLKTLEGFYCALSEAENDEGPPITNNVVGVDRVNFNGNDLRYCNDGGVVKSVEEVEREGTKYLRLRFDMGPLVTNFDVPEFIDIPVSLITERVEEVDGPGLTINSTGLELDLGVGSGGAGGSSHEHDNKDLLDKFGIKFNDENYLYNDDRIVWTSHNGGVISEFSVDENGDISIRIETGHRENEVLTIPAVPTKVSQLTNDSKFVTAEYVTAAINGSLDEIEAMIDESGVLDE